MRIALRTGLLTLTLLAASSAPANALEIFGNPGLGNAGRNLGNDYDKLAQGFTMGSTSYSLSSLDIGLRFGSPVPTTSEMLIRLFTDSAGNPGSLIGSFNTASPTPAFVASNNNVYRLNYSGTLTLAANTTYWVVVETTPTSPLFDWYYASGGPTNTPTVQNGSGVSYAGTRAVVAGTTPWTNIGGSFSGLRYSINVVPEPSTYALGLAGTLVMGTIARRRNRKTASA